MSENEITKDFDIRPSSIALWISILSGPVAFAINLESRYALVQWACFNHRTWSLHVISATTLVASIGGALLGWAMLGRLARDAERERFMAMSGFILGAIFALTTLANWIPQFFLTPCD